MIAVQVTALPELLPALGLQAGSAVGPKVDIDASLLDKRSGRCMGIEPSLCLLRIRHIEHLDVVNDVGAFEVHADSEQFRPLFAAGRQPAAQFQLENIVLVRGS